MYILLNFVEFVYISNVISQFWDIILPGECYIVRSWVHSSKLNNYILKQECMLANITTKGTKVWLPPHCTIIYFLTHDPVLVIPCASGLGPSAETRAPNRPSAFKSSLMAWCNTLAPDFKGMKNKLTLYKFLFYDKKSKYGSRSKCQI